MIEDAQIYKPRMNPAFVKRVQAKRREEARQKRMREKLARHREAASILGRSTVRPDLRNRPPAQTPEEASLRAEIRFHELIFKMRGGDKLFRITPKKVIEVVALKHDVLPEEILGVSRKKEIVKARHEAIFEVHRRFHKLSLPRLGQIFNRDHTTILHALRKADARKDAA